MQRQVDEVQHCHQSSEARQDTCWRFAVAFGPDSHVSLMQEVEEWWKSSHCAEFFICFQHRRRFGVICSSAAESALQSAPFNYFASLKWLSQQSCAALTSQGCWIVKIPKVKSSLWFFQTHTDQPAAFERTERVYRQSAASSRPVGWKPKLRPRTQSKRNVDWIEPLSLEQECLHEAVVIKLIRWLIDHSKHKQWTCWTFYLIQCHAFRNDVSTNFKEIILR